MGRGGRALIGAGVGLLGGAVIGFAIGMWRETKDPSAHQVTWALLGAGTGAALGAGGAAIPTPSCQR